MVIKLSNVWKTYEKDVLKGITYSFESGKIYVIKGVSGCGKSTLLNLIGGLDQPNKGSIVTDTDGVPSDYTSYLFQNSLLISKLTVIENLLLINADRKRIMKLAKSFGVLEQLHKYPFELSGGERQRIAVIRALLRPNKIILADEPTASLDLGNSELVAKTLAMLRSDGRILIVATHENCFDEYADEILYLNYGKIERTEIIAQKALSYDTVESTVTAENGKGMGCFRYALKRNPKLLKTWSILSLSLAFLLIFVVSTVENSFANEYLRMIKDEYPMDLVRLTPEQKKEMENYCSVRTYECYTASDNEYKAYYLPDEKDSVFAIGGVITHGRFPEKPNEILASNEFLADYFGGCDDYSQYVGRKIVFLKCEFTVVGTVESTDGDIESFLVADPCYDTLRRTVKCKAVFIPYETMRSVGNKVEGWDSACVIDGLYDNRGLRKRLSDITENEYPNTFYSNVAEAHETVSHASGIFAVVLMLTSALSGIYVATLVSSELFYRRRELGYLQIFGLDKRRIVQLILAEYSIKIFASLVCALVGWAVLALLYRVLIGAFVTFDIPFTLALSAFVIAFYLFAVYVSSKIFIKKRVIDIIT